MPFKGPRQGELQGTAGGGPFGKISLVWGRGQIPFEKDAKFAKMSIFWPIMESVAAVLGRLPGSIEAPGSGGKGCKRAETAGVWVRGCGG